MSAEQPQAMLERAQALRAELKAWERAFATTHDGRKAGRDDIRQDAAIALKYKEYTNLRNLASGRAARPTKCDSVSGTGISSPLKRKASASEDPSRLAKTPRRQHVPTVTPSKLVHPTHIDPYDSPAVVRRLQFTPSHDHHHHLAVVGPTPQRDGKVLGLFDLMDDTPEKKGDPSENALDIPTDHHQTPSKPAAMDHEFVTPLKHSRTPTSSSRRFFLDMFVTPSKRRDAAALEGEEEEEEGGTGTPSFLRRRGGRRSRPTEESFATCFKVKPAGKCLSALIADLRKLENEKADEDLDVLRELEQEEEAGMGTRSVRSGLGHAEAGMDLKSGNPKDASFHATDVFEDSGEAIHDENAPTITSKKPWKKRGQKRTTKRVIIRPSLKSITNPSSGPTTTAITTTTNETHRHDPSHASQSMVDPNGDNNDDDDNDSIKENHPIDNTNNKNNNNLDSNDTKTKDEKKKKKKKKSNKKGINGNATSHANFRRLKLRNRNSKGQAGGYAAAAAGGGGGRRFGGGGGGRNGRR